MATKNSRKIRKAEETIEPLVIEEKKTDMPEKKYIQINKKVLGLGVGALVLVLIGFWYTTNTWPIAAIANGKVITRFTLNKNLYQQGGKSVLDNLVTEQLVKTRLDRDNVRVSREEVDQRLDELKTQLPEGADLNTILAERGMTEADLKNQIELQMRIEKAVAQKIEVTDEELDSYVKENESFLTGTSSAEKRDAARQLLQNDKSQTEITAWVNQIRNEAKVWTPDGSWKAE